MEAVVWLASLDSSANRAHMAAGLAHAFAANASCVSLMEVCRGLPNIGYYFGMEQARYLAPALDRHALVSGTWGGAIRFSFASNLSVFERSCASPLPAAAPHVIIVAFPCPENSRGGICFPALPAAAAILSENGSQDLFPDAVVIAGNGANAARVRGAAALTREVAPQAMVYFVSRGAVAAPAEAEEHFDYPEGLRASWARRTPPEEPWFGDIAASLSQLISQKRKKGVIRAANE